MQCPSCHGGLVRRSTPHGLVYVCGRCKGRSVTLPVLRGMGAGRKWLGDLWQKSRRKGVPLVRRCPLCGRHMAQVHAEKAGEDVVLDVCPGCPAIWFDASEFKSVPREALEPQKDPEVELSPEARQKLAILQVEMESGLREQEGMSVSELPEEGWHWLPGLLGMPVELDAPTLSRRPLVTWTLAALCVLATLPILFGSQAAGMQLAWKWGFVPAEWDRHGGLTLITSFFLHGGLFHILGNMYFLLVFGDNVEDRLGPGLYVLLLLLAHGCGMAAQGFFDPHPLVPCIGASAGISGVIAYYAAAFPRVRLQFMFRYWLMFRWVQIPAAWALGFYALFQIIGVHMQLSGFGGISYLGHVGGLAVGLSAAMLHRSWQKRATSTTIREIAA